LRRDNNNKLIRLECNLGASDTANTLSLGSKAKSCNCGDTF